ncbi:TetR/AcrR family transcriptional regulator [Rothia sp. LK2588]|uniref:TetR/AcrR family transcriptional regulator n=1 Tax=Rothia sp. LK2588 TaxID=3114369 RepID=UPI0034CEA352
MTFSKPLACDKRVARKAATHRAILEAAEQIAIDEGRAALTTKRLVEVAGVSERTVFNHFANLNAVLIAALASHLQELMNSSEFPTGLPLAELPQACETYICEGLDKEDSHAALNRFITLAATGFIEVAGEQDAIGKEVLQTLGQQGSSLYEKIAACYPQLDQSQHFQLYLYVCNCVMAIGFGMGQYVTENPQTLENPALASGDDLRACMITAIRQVGQGMPRF